MPPKKQPTDTLNKLRDDIRKVHWKYEKEHGTGFFSKLSEQTKLSNSSISHFYHGRRGLKLDGYLRMSELIKKCLEDENYINSFDIK